MKQIGTAEIAMRRAVRPVEELHRQRPVEAQLVLDLGDRLGRGVGAGDVDRETARQAREREADDQHRQADEYREQERTQEEPTHAPPIGAGEAGGNMAGMACARWRSGRFRSIIAGRVDGDR